MAEQAAWIIHRGMKYVPQRDVAQARAEVLAACAKKARTWYTNHPKGKHGRDYLGIPTCSPCEDARRLEESILEVQPAASSLEALLREAELKGRIAQLNMMKGDDAGGMWFPDPGTQTINARIAELEKARASGGK